ncbi:MAG TPA: cytochrome c [Gemmataceae bacterium]|nr:cytochrome c [Gemmataceae bacterium]
MGAGTVAALVFAAVALLTAAAHAAKMPRPWVKWAHPAPRDGVCVVPGDCPSATEWEGTWYWLRSPEQERRVVISLYNRYCLRCHGVDGRGVWDIPDVPDFTNVRWQACRSDAQLARIILEGRGAVMPAFRGTLTLEEAWAMARYLRTFIPGTETPRPDYQEPGKQAEELPPPAPVEPGAPDLTFAAPLELGK